MDDETQVIVCECDDLNCRLEVKVPVELALQLLNDDPRVIVNGCQTPLPEGTTLVKSYDGFSVYQLPD